MFVNPRAIPSFTASPRCVTRESSSTASSSRRCRRASISMTTWSLRRLTEQLFGGHEAHTRLTRGKVEEGAHHALERRVDFPVVRGQAEVATGPSAPPRTGAATRRRSCRERGCDIRIRRGSRTAAGADKRANRAGVARSRADTAESSTSSPRFAIPTAASTAETTETSRGC